MDKWVGVLGGGAGVSVLGIAGLGFGLALLIPAGATLMAIGLGGIVLQNEARRVRRARFRPVARFTFCMGHHFFGA